jgi:hypothetical protein
MKLHKIYIALLPTISDVWYVANSIIKPNKAFIFN